MYFSSKTRQLEVPSGASGPLVHVTETALCAASRECFGNVDTRATNYIDDFVFAFQEGDVLAGTTRIVDCFRLSLLPSIRNGSEWKPDERFEISSFQLSQNIIFFLNTSTFQRYKLPKVKCDRLPPDRRSYAKRLTKLSASGCSASPHPVLDLFIKPPARRSRSGSRTQWDVADSGAANEKLYLIKGAIVEPSHGLDDDDDDDNCDGDYDMQNGDHEPR